jgi:hypothetical protein
MTDASIAAFNEQPRQQLIDRREVVSQRQRTA